ncbi:MAG: hypothetical protein K2Y18_06890 [Alphaproteobacteria bacterium]|nr:hypothetical protein [Alphaproteobacteria bacterium]
MFQLVQKENQHEVTQALEPLEQGPRGPFSSCVHLQGPGLYTMTVEDPSHYLGCELILEIEPSPDEQGESVVICHFPKIEEKLLNTFVMEDDSLFVILLIEYQMKILKELFLFCATNYAKTLVIYCDDKQAEDLDIYREFLSFIGLIDLGTETVSVMTIPADKQTFQAYIEFMYEVCLKFRQELWQEQRNNPAIQQYLKIHPFTGSL